MKRLLVLLVPAVAVAIPLAGAQAQPVAPDASEAAQRSICHRVGSAARPYRKIRVTARQLRAHLRHAADIIPAGRGACPRTILTPTSGGTAFEVGLTGEAETPAGDPVGTGVATVRIRRGEGRVCFSMRVAGITLPSVGAHIHRGGPAVAGPIVVPLRAPNASGTASGCAAAARGVVAQLLANPERYYVNVHTTEFPGGAVRGQLRGSSTEALGRTISIQLTGAAECNAAGVCNLGDLDGAGTATVRFRREGGQVCFRLRVQGIQLPSVGAHIHRGGPRTAGPIVVNFEPPNASGVAAGCTAATAALIEEIVGNPAGFYVNVHTREFPAGAVRGQLG